MTDYFPTVLGNALCNPQHNYLILAHDEKQASAFWGRIRGAALTLHQATQVSPNRLLRMYNGSTVRVMSQQDPIARYKIKGLAFHGILLIDEYHEFEAPVWHVAWIEGVLPDLP